ncbi:MAG: hypothetical protein KatS3mg014_0268 [Actinomycetota bacterium]|nr:MAG: hypothetical protein KatS3mg014_0268 [Actinomycetota bacterium]
MAASAPPPWPTNAVLDDAGLRVAGVAAEELAARFGTPLLVADEAHLRERARTFARLFPHPLYAVKAFTSHHVIRLVLEEGLDLLAATEGEVEACLRAGAPPSRIVLHGNNKSDAELSLAVDEGLRLVNVDNPDELERLDRIARERGVVQDILLRVLPEVGAGAPPRDPHGGRRVRSSGCRWPRSPPSWPGRWSSGASDRSGCTRTSAPRSWRSSRYLAAVDVLLDLLVELRDRTGFEADVLDLGGGVRGWRTTDETPLSLDELAPAPARPGARGRAAAGAPRAAHARRAGVGPWWGRRW